MEGKEGGESTYNYNSIKQKGYGGIHKNLVTEVLEQLFSLSGQQSSHFNIKK